MRTNLLLLNLRRVFDFNLRSPLIFNNQSGDADGFARIVNLRSLREVTTVLNPDDNGEPPWVGIGFAYV